MLCVVYQIGMQLDADQLTEEIGEYMFSKKRSEKRAGEKSKSRAGNRGGGERRPPPDRGGRDRPPPKGGGFLAPYVR